MIAASLHYFRRSATSLAADFQALRRVGADAVESPVPWSAHDERGRIAFDRDGAHLVAFLEQASQAGLAVHLRLGPLVGADLTGLGLPPDVAADRESAARHPDGSPQVVPLPPRWFFAPSYAARAYRERARAWVAAAAEAVRPFLSPDGPVRGVVLGDVWPFAGRSPIASPDFHPDALAAWEATRAAASLAERDRLFPSRPAAPSSDDPAEVLAGIGLARFAESLYVDFLDTLAAAAASAFGGTATLGTVFPPAGLFAPVGVGRLARAFDAVGLDAYGWVARPVSLDRDAHLVAGSVRRPFASFVPVGTPPYLPHLAVADQLHGLQICLAAGLRGVTLSMGVGRDRWCGGLLDETLHEIEPAHLYRRLLHGLARSSWLHGRPRPLAALLVPRDYVRGALSAAAALVGPPAPGLAAAFGFVPAAALDPADRTPGGGAWWRWFEIAERSLQDLGVPYELVNDESPATVGAPLLLAPTLAACPRAVVERLRAQLARGAAVLCGPEHPAHDLASGAAADVPGLPPPLAALDASAVAAALAARHHAPPADRLERSTLHDEAGTLVGLALLNRSRRDVPLGLALENLPLGPESAGQERSWVDLDEPGAAPAAGAIASGGIRLLVPAGPRRREGP